MAPSDTPPNTDAALAAREETLFDGTRVTIRPIRPGDRGLVESFVRSLSDETRHYRFEKQFPRPTEPMLAFLTEVDQRSHVALLCIVMIDGVEQEIGEARFVSAADGRTAEFAVAVADAWQGTGVAGRLMQAIEAVASQRGLQALEGFVAATNRKMLRFVQARGYRVDHDPRDAKTVRVVKTL